MEERRVESQTRRRVGRQDDAVGGMRCFMNDLRGPPQDGLSVVSMTKGHGSSERVERRFRDNPGVTGGGDRGADVPRLIVRTIDSTTRSNSETKHTSGGGAGGWDRVEARGRESGGVERRSTCHHTHTISVPLSSPCFPIVPFPTPFNTENFREDLRLPSSLPTYPSHSLRPAANV